MEVSFYTDAADPLGFACRLVRRARSSGRPLGICAPMGVLKRLDTLLWTFDPAEFIPHRIGEPLSPDEVGLVEAPDLLGHRALLLNLGVDMPGAAPEFERILDVVGCEPESVLAARHRYRAYRQFGAQISHVKVSR